LEILRLFQGNAALRQGQLDAAAEYFTAAIAAEPRYARARLGLGAVKAAQASGGGACQPGKVDPLHLLHHARSESINGVHVTTINMPLVRTPMIAPTKMYDRFPTITPEEAADMICEAIIHKPKRIATPMGTLGQILYALNPKSIDYILNTAYHLFPDSAAAKGDKPKAEAGAAPAQTTDEQANSQQILFANLMRGMHW
jgi:hypothetical protein